VKPPPFTYHRPQSVADALHLLDTLENPKLLAGGQSLMPMLNLRYVFPDHVIDLNRVDGLAGIREDGDDIEIGGTTRQRDIELSAVLGRKAPIFAEALRVVGHVQTRNRGTIGGSLCHLDPASELPTIALAYDARISVAGSRGNRTIPMREFIAGPMTPSIESNEIVTAIRFSPWTGRHGHAFEEFSRRHGDFAPGVDRACRSLHDANQAGGGRSRLDG
jgi:carbon-monoxide dehydrogenase medium subunit